MLLSTPSRRDFLRIATLTTAGALVGGGLLRGRALARAQADDKPLYCFPLLGDLHYDDMSHHDLDWVRSEKAGDERQMLNYSKVTREFTPRLFAEVSDAIRQAPAAVPFVVQVGDLVEGLCGSQDLATRQFNEAFGAIRAAKFGVPFLMTKGNHDITGPGAQQAFDQTLLPWLAGQVKIEFQGASYVQRHDDDAFIFLDGYRPDLDWLQNALSRNKARHVFVIVHQPVVPYNARANWIVFPNKNQADERQRLLSLLAEHRAIVLGGHIHKYSLLTRSVGQSAFVQLAVCSVLRRAEEKSPRDHLTGAEQYNDGLLALEPKFAPKTLDYRRSIIAGERAGIRAFEYADVPGYAMVKVYPDRVDADIFLALATDAWKTDALVPAGRPTEAR